MSNWEYTEGTLPWTKTCFVCGEDNPHGLRGHSCVEGDRVVLTHVTRAADLGYRHLVHGGISMTLLDEVMTWAAILTFKRACVAAELTVRLQQPILVGQSIRVEGWITRAKARLVEAGGRIVDSRQVVLATAVGKYVPMSGEGLRLCLKDFVESPGAIYLPFLQDKE
ncbi:MAG: PaaI family thioesterase [bacterium]|jgi:acyl-coenzyme A thioesterase PaaI-like protein